MLKVPVTPAPIQLPLPSSVAAWIAPDNNQGLAGSAGSAWASVPPRHRTGVPASTWVMAVTQRGCGFQVPVSGVPAAAVPMPLVSVRRSAQKMSAGWPERHRA